MKLPNILHTFYTRRSIKHKLLIWFLLFSLMPLAIAGYFAYSTASSALKSAVEEKMSRIVINGLDKIDRNLLERFEDVQVWAALELAKMAAQIGSGIGGASDFANYIVGKYRVYALIMLLDRQGICVTVNTMTQAHERIPTEALFLGKDFSQESWFTEIAQHDDIPVAVTDWHKISVLATLAEQTHQNAETAYSVAFSAPIRDRDGSFLGVWVNFLDWSIFQGILDQTQTAVPEVATASMGFLLAADNDTILAYSGVHPEPGKPLYGKSLARDLFQPQLVDLLADQEGILPYFWDGKPKTIALAREKGYEYYSGKNWNYLLISDNDSTYAQIITLRTKLFLIGVGSTGIILLLAYMIGRQLAAPLVSLSRTTTKIANGELSQHIATIISYEPSPDSHNEVDILLLSFKQMTENLQSLIRQIKDASARVRESSVTISDAVQQLSNVSEQQSSEILETTATIEDLAATSRGIAQNAKTVAEFAELTELDAHKGVGAAVATLHQIQDIKNTNDQNRQYVMLLNARSQEINRIVEVITNIADTTELIAFNAALEAASAGEKGHRFGVVAGEIRRLATTVATSVKDIDHKASEIQHGIKTLVNVFDAETQVIEKGVHDMKVTTTSFEAILEKIERTTTSLAQISEATRQQQTSNDVVVATLQDMSEGTKQLQHIAHQSLDITTELNHLAEELQQRVNLFQIEE